MKCAGCRGFIVRCCIALIVAAFARAAIAQDWSITTADFQTRPTVLRSISRENLRVEFPGLGEPSTIAIDQFVSIQRSANQSHRVNGFTLLLQGGDRLTGMPLKVADEQLIWQSNSLGEISVPMAKLVAMSRLPDVNAPTEAPKQDMITLANGDSVAGVVVDCSGDKITVRTDSGPTGVPVATVSRIVFAGTSQQTAAAARGYRIALADGSSITSSDATVADNQLSLAIDSKPPRNVTLPLDQVLAIEQLNGPVSWLSSRTPSENVQIPYFSGSTPWPARMDAAGDGSPLRLGNQTYAHGIGVHAYSRLSFAIEPGWSTFRTQYTIDSRPDLRRPLADITVRITLDGKVVHEQQHVRVGSPAPVITVDLKDAKLLTLEADYGDGGDTQDHLNWIEAALVRSKSQ